MATKGAGCAICWCKYDFVAVRRADGHEALKLFERDIRGSSLLACKVGTFIHNLFQ